MLIYEAKWHHPGSLEVFTTRLKVDAGLSGRELWEHAADAMDTAYPGKLDMGGVLTVTFVVNTDAVYYCVKRKG